MSQLVPALDRRLSDPVPVCLADQPGERPSRRIRRGALAVRRTAERGLVSAEWTFVIIAAIAIVGILVSIINTGPVRSVLTQVIMAILKAALALL